MKILYERSFMKDVQKVDQRITQKCYSLITELKLKNHVQEVPHIKKLIGYQNYYRIRIGDYRLGCKIIDDTLICIHLKHRKDIYKIFP